MRTVAALSADGLVVAKDQRGCAGAVEIENALVENAAALTRSRIGGAKTEKRGIGTVPAQRLILQELAGAGHRHCSVGVIVNAAARSQSGRCHAARGVVAYRRVAFDDHVDEIERRPCGTAGAFGIENPTAAGRST